jgi:hypothetical protein
MKPSGKHWDNFKELHSTATWMWVEENFGKAISRDDFIIAHEDTCKSRKHTYEYCAKDLFKFLTKWNWIKDASKSK